MLAFASVWLLAASASANGAYTHVHISQLAHAMLPPGELRALLDAQTHAYECGSLFPDSGYAIDDDYGELAHWEPFLEAYIQDIRARYGGDYTSETARDEIAFLLGVASHGMADQSYDTTLLARAFEVDGPEPSGRAVDQYADYFLVIDEEVELAVAPWAPYEPLPAVIADASGGHVVTADTLMRAMSRMSGVVDFQGNPRLAGRLYWDAWESFPFLGTHLYNEDAMGSLPWLGALIAEYWEVVWRRLHGVDDPDQDLVIRTVPADGAQNVSIDRSESEAWGRIAIFFGYGVERDQVAPLITLRDEAGETTPVTFQTAYNGRERNLLFVVPTESLAYDHVYTVEVAPGARALGGQTSSAPTLFSFRTRCAPDNLDDCPPLDPPLVTGPIPARPVPVDAGPPPDAGSEVEPGGGGGCSVSSRPSPASLALLLLALALGAARRARMNRGASRREDS